MKKKKTQMSDCSNCKFNYFCCKMRVQVSFWERLRILLHGHWGCFEKDPSGKWVIAFNNDQCVFLEKGRCRIYSIRPRVCREFPNRGTCEELFSDLAKIKKERLRFLGEAKLP